MSINALELNTTTDLQAALCSCYWDPTPLCTYPYNSFALLANYRPFGWIGWEW